MKTINLYFDFEFTSLSPDAQPISLGIVSDENKTDINTDPKKIAKAIIGQKQSEFFPAKSFYAEFTDFDIGRCDDWVKENVVSKLIGHSENKQGLPEAFHGNTSEIKAALKSWLDNFSDYQLQFVCDCGTYDWYWMLQLLDERNTSKGVYMIPSKVVPPEMTSGDFLKEFEEAMHSAGSIIVLEDTDFEIKEIKSFQTGLPKLPSNISPVPQDLNDIIALKKRISVREAFDLSRNELAHSPVLYNQRAHNALFDARIIKSIYQKLKH